MDELIIVKIIVIERIKELFKAGDSRIKERS